jgi:hypothetical protein
VVALGAAIELDVVDMNVAADGHATLQTRAGHPFSGAKQLVMLTGLGQGLDGSHAVVTAAAHTSEF